MPGNHEAEGNGRGLHDYREGETIAIRGDEYEIVGVDPTRDGVRSYQLEGDTDMTARLDVNDRKGNFYLILVGEVSPDEVSLRTDN